MREEDERIGKIKFSIIVAVYNVEPYLNECIDSILSQTYQNYELILVNDGSTDGSREICEVYRRRDSRVRFIHKEQNEGLVRARKAGLSAATGEYASYVDGDDRVTDDWLLKIYSNLKTDLRPDIIAYGYERFYRSHVIKTGNPLAAGRYESHDPAFRSEVLCCGSKPFFSFGLYPSVCTKVFSRALLEKWQFQAPDDIAMGEDLAVSLPAILSSRRIQVLDEYFYQYRVNVNSMTLRHSDDELRQLLVLAKYLQQVLKADGQRPALENQLYCYVLFRMEQIFFAAAKSKTWGEFKALHSHELMSELQSMADRARIGKAGLKKRCSILLLKRRQYRLLYFLIRLKNIKAHLIFGKAGRDKM